MHARAQLRTVFAGFGVTGSLLAAIGAAFAVTGGVMAFDGWPGLTGPPPERSIAVPEASLAPFAVTADAVALPAAPAVATPTGASAGGAGAGKQARVAEPGVEGTTADAIVPPLPLPTAHPIAEPAPTIPAAEPPSITRSAAATVRSVGAAVPALAPVVGPVADALEDVGRLL